MRMKLAQLVLLLQSFLLLTPLASAQGIEGSAIIRFDATTGKGTATCATSVDESIQYYYNATILCRVNDSTGKLIAAGGKTDTGGQQGAAFAVVSFTGTPGETYTVTGVHSAQFTISHVVNDLPSNDPYEEYTDEQNFSYYESLPTQTYISNYTWTGPGPPVQERSGTVRVGQTTASAIRYYTLSELTGLITAAQGSLASRCNTVFTQAIGPSYTNAAFFSSLHATTFLQYPLGAPNTPSHGSADADTLITQSGRPIRLFPNFYPTKVGLLAGFQSSVLIHEGVHHFTGWLDFSDGSTTPNFIAVFQPYGYRNTSGTTGDFSNWILAGCPAAP